VLKENADHQTSYRRVTPCRPAADRRERGYSVLSDFVIPGMSGWAGRLWMAAISVRSVSRWIDAGRQQMVNQTPTQEINALAAALARTR
jgi:hypothetical protein